MDAFVRFRYGDGFTNSRALALQACLAVVPFLLALTGLASDIDEERPARVIARTIEMVSPVTAPTTRWPARSPARPAANAPASSPSPWVCSSPCCR